MGDQKRYRTQPDSISVVKVLLNSISSPTPSTILHSILRHPGGKTIVGNKCSTVRGGKRRRRERRRMKEVKDKEKAIDDGEEDREKRTLMESGTKLTPVRRISMETPRTLSSRIGTPSSSKLSIIEFDITGLLNPTCKTVADMMIGKTPEEMRTHFNINNNMGL
ncbi:hypothetical protein IGI04_006253 [Brassica rapa subsp. trilocularis]|uniref:SKP1 component dimerisation domain-containing protein n=1 Tax=Brassica rapa subsp. trilocularis TaxID=1813537 RepID=A0ABQ7NJK4_BRACM|nr:hypothetical protein IGI04_006253 [Brassica rapa subsp. trilocularis]